MDYQSNPPILSAHELHIWQAGLDIDQPRRQALEAHLHADERERAARFVFARDRHRFVVARGLLRQLLGMYLQVQPADVQFGYTAYGKPFLLAPEAEARLQFNLSHSGTLAIYALAWDRQVGVDVEYIRQDLDYAAMLDSVFTQREQRVLAALPEGQRRAAFFRGWVRKEAYVKAHGKGLSTAPDSFEVNLLANEPDVLRLPPEAGDQRWSLHGLEAGAGYAAAVVAEGSIAGLQCFRIG
jgi:4'-phosphopantetheinyl transferase